MLDLKGNELLVGATVGCAFSFSQASVGYIRVGQLSELDHINKKLKVTWEDGKLSPWLSYGGQSRWIIL